MASGRRGTFLDRSAWNLPREGEGVYAEAEQRVREACAEGKISNRRLRRWVNDRLLRELAPPLDSIEIGGLFAPPPWGERNYQTPLEKLTEGGGAALAAAWEPFRDNVDMDHQAEVLRKLEKTGKNKEGAALCAWRAVDHKARDALKRRFDSPLLPVLESQLLEFVSGGDDELVLEVPAPHHRLLVHGLSQFHGLASQSEPAPPPPRVHISKRASCRREAAKDSGLNLTKFLQDCRQPPVLAPTSRL